MYPRHLYFLFSVLGLALVAFLHFWWRPIPAIALSVIFLVLLGVYDMFQVKSNILRNYPVWGHWRYLLLMIRPQIQQYFIHTDQSGRPFNTEQRNMVYARADKALDKVPFGTQLDVGATGYEWINHSMRPISPDAAGLRIKVGGSQCAKPYLASRLNISAMSYGALSQNAIRALNRGAKIGGFAHNTGEGGLSRYHLMEEGDIIWQIGTGYFGCKTKNGQFDPEKFKEKACLDNIKMIEIKISQGAKPAHGGILLGSKVTKIIAEARGVEEGEDCVSPPAHSAFSTPLEMMKFITQLRELSGGKPVGFKLCVGLRSDFMAICKAMLETGVYPDFITVDGAEGGTGAAPVEFTNFVGTPLADALIFVHNTLVGIGLRDEIRVIASGKILSGFDIATKIALGADLCNSARGMMFSLGCVQSRRCHDNTCPTGIATQDPKLMYALVVDDKAPRVANFHESTLASFLEVLGAAGLERPELLTPCHIHRRTADSTNRSYDHIYSYIEEGSLLDGDSIPDRYRYHWEMAHSNEFSNIAERMSSVDWQHHKHIYMRKTH